MCRKGYIYKQIVKVVRVPVALVKFDLLVTATNPCKSLPQHV